MRRYEMVPRRSNPSSAELAARIREMNLGDKAGRAARRTYEFGREYLPKAGRVLYSAAKTGAKYGGMTLAAVGKYGGRAAEFVGSGVESWGRKRNPSSRRKTSPMSEHRFHVYSSSSRIPVYTSDSLKDARGTFVAGKQAALSSMKMGDYGSPAYGEVFALTRDGAIVETSALKTSFEAAFGIVGQPIEAFFEYYDVPSSKRKRNPSSERKTSAKRNRFEAWVSLFPNQPIGSYDNAKVAKASFAKGNAATAQRYDGTDFLPFPTALTRDGIIIALTRDGIALDATERTSRKLLGQPIKAFFAHFRFSTQVRAEQMQEAERRLKAAAKLPSKRKRNPSSRLEPVLVPRAVYSRRMR